MPENTRHFVTLERRANARLFDYLQSISNPTATSCLLKSDTLIYTMNVAFEQLETVFGDYETIDFLLDALYQNKVHEIRLCYSFAIYQRWDAIIKIVDFLRQNRFNEFYQCKWIFETQGLENAIAYLNTISRPVIQRTLNDVNIDTQRLNSILQYTGNAGLSYNQQHSLKICFQKIFLVKNMPIKPILI